MNRPRYRDYHNNDHKLKEPSEEMIVWNYYVVFTKSGLKKFIHKEIEEYLKNFLLIEKSKKDSAIEPW